MIKFKMKEHKYPKLEDLPKDNKYYFFTEGISPEEEEKKKQNQNHRTRKQNPFIFSIPIKQKKVPIIHKKLKN